MIKLNILWFVRHSTNEKNRLTKIFVKTYSLNSPYPRKLKTFLKGR